MANKRDVQLDIVGTDNTDRATSRARRGFESLNRAVDKTSAALNKEDGLGKKVAKSLLSVAKATAKATATAAAYASALGSTAIGLIAVGKFAVTAGKALAGLNPLLAFLPSIAASVALIGGAIKLAAPGILRGLEPITRAFFDADGNASALTKRVQDLAGRGLAPLAREFVRVNLPSIAAAMDHIAISTNKVVGNTLRWLNTTEGQRTIWMLSTSTALAFERLAPKVDAAVVALGRLTGRTGNDAINGLADAVGRLLDRFTVWANSTSSEDIGKALDDLAGYTKRLKSAWESVRKFGAWLGENEGKIRAFTTAVSAIAIVVGIATGTWLPALIGGLVLLATNFDKIEGPAGRVATAVKSVVDAVKGNENVGALLDSIRKHAETMRPVLEQFAVQFGEKILPKLKELGAVIMNEVVPALTGLVDAVSPFVKELAERVGPIVTAVFGGIVDVIKGAVHIITGIINVFVGLLTGDWSKLWDGLLQIARGFGEIITGTVQTTLSVLGKIFSGAWAYITSQFTSAKDKITGAFAGAGDWLRGIGTSIIDGLVNGITGAAGRVSSALSGLLDRARNSIPAPLRGALGFSTGTGSWMPRRIAAQFAGAAGFADRDSGGGGRTGGPTPIALSLAVNLDGQPFHAMTSTVVTESERRADWRGQVGGR